MRADALLGQALDIPTLVRRTFSNLVQRMSPHLAQSGHPSTLNHAFNGLVAGHFLLSSYRMPTSIFRPKFWNYRPHMCSQHRTEGFGVTRQSAGAAPKHGNVRCQLAAAKD